MAEAKTQPTDASVPAFLETIDNDEKQKDARTLVTLMRRVTGEKPRMWGPSIVGFGQYHYRYASGRQGDAALAGFSPRKQNLTIYIMSGFRNLRPLLKRLGKHTTSVSCLYIKRLSDVDLAVLEAIVRQGVEETRAMDWEGETARRTTGRG